MRWKENYHFAFKIGLCRHGGLKARYQYKKTPPDRRGAFLLLTLSNYS